jgi:4'-phosphopantetheinyl transferase EntD
MKSIRDRHRRRSLAAGADQLEEPNPRPVPSVLPQLLDPRVLSGEGNPTELGRFATLLPEEEQAISRAVEARRTQYAAARHLARALLSELGYGRPALLNRDDRSPIWPYGVVGSITHTEHWCGVAMAEASQVRGVGIDAETVGRMDAPVATRVLTARERRAVERLDLPRENDASGHAQSPSPMDWATLLFSAKEAVYKCIFPTVQRFVGFEEVEIDVDVASSCFEVSAKSDQLRAEHQQLVEHIVGRFTRHGDHWITTCLIAD